MNLLEIYKSTDRGDMLVGNGLSLENKGSFIETIMNLPFGMFNLLARGDWKAERSLVNSLFKDKQCPDCGHTRFLEGPHGGNCTNIKCANCGSKFNVCLPWFAERI